MSVSIFPSKVGVAAVVSDPNVVPMTFSMTGLPPTNCIIQGISGTTQGNYQFLLTLMNFTYVYIFGEKMGDFTVTGITMADDCAGTGTNGMTGAIGYYNSRAISVTGTPVVIGFAGWAAYAFLTGATFTAMNPRSGLGQFQLHLKTITQ